MITRKKCCQLAEHHKIFDGRICYNSEMSEEEIKEVNVRQLVLKDSVTHDLCTILPSSFDYVCCVNRKVCCITTVLLSTL